MSVLESSPQTSCCAWSGKRASCQLCTDTTPSTHAEAGHALATMRATSKKMCGCASAPPQRLGWSARKKPAACMSAMVSRGTCRSARAWGTRASSAGTSASARATSSLRSASSGRAGLWL